MRRNIDLMTIFVSLREYEFRAALIAMWSEAFTAWASLHGRPDDESSEQLAEYENFLRGSIWHLKQLRDAPRQNKSDERASKHAENVLTGIFAHVARLIAFAEQKIAGGKMPRGQESAVLGREALVSLLDNDFTLLDEAIKRRFEEHPTD